MGLFVGWMAVREEGKTGWMTESSSFCSEAGKSSSICSDKVLQNVVWCSSKCSESGRKCLQNVVKTGMRRYGNDWLSVC